MPDTYKKQNNSGNKKSINLMQLNCHRSKAVTANLANTLIFPNQISLLQEPHTHKNKLTGLAGLNTLARGENPRAAIVADRNINLWLDQGFSSRDISTVILKTET